MDDITREFLIESNENLATLDQQIVQLEQNPSDPALLASIFRTMHTIKGTGGMLGFSAVEGIAHLAESLLSQVRGGTRALTPALTSLILKAVDAIKAELVSIESTGEERGFSHDPLKEELARACEAKSQTPIPPDRQASKMRHEVVDRGLWRRNGFVAYLAAAPVFSERLVSFRQPWTRRRDAGSIPARVDSLA